MTQPDTGQRRREDDFKLNPEQAENLYPATDRRRTGSRVRHTPGRSFLRRFKQPIIGLSIVGAAAPLINAGTSHEHKPAAEPEHATAATPTEAHLAREAAAQPAGPTTDVEEQLATRIAAETHSSARSDVVGHAVNKYKIDESLAHDIYELAEQEGIAPKLAYGLVKTESSFKTKAKSGVGARGLTQVMPKTAAWMLPGTKAEDLYNPRVNLKLGFRYLNQLIGKYKGDVRLALLAYNRGPGTVDKILKRGGNPNNGYADKVLGG